MGDIKISRPTPAPPSYPAPGVPKASPAAAVSASEKTASPAKIPAPSYPAPKPPASQIDLSTPEARSKDLSAVQNPEILPRNLSKLPTMHMSGPSQETRTAANLVGAMQDPKFGKILEKFSPSLGQRFLQAFGKSSGSVDGSRFKKNVARMLPLINIGVYGKDAMRAHQHKNALNGIAEHAKTNNNHLALQLAQSLGAHEKSKRNTQIISGAVSVATTAVAFVPGAQVAPVLTQASSSLATSLGGGATSALGLHYTAAAAIDSGIKTTGSMLASTAASYGQDYAVSKVDREGQARIKMKMGSGYSKLKVSMRGDSVNGKLETEMGYQAARAMVNYLGPARGAGEAHDSPRMLLRQSLGATDPSRTYVVSEDKKAERARASQMDVHDGRQDYLQMFFDIGVKGAMMPYEG